MKALATGGAGLIGSHLAEALWPRGVQVVALDNLRLGRVAELAWKRSGDALEFLEDDAGDEKLLRKVLPGCDWIVHEAALPSVPESVADPITSNAQNLDVALRLAGCGPCCAGDSSASDRGSAVRKHNFVE